MATGFRKFLEGLRIIPKSSSTASEQGDLDVTSSSGKLNYHNGTSSSPVVTEDHSATLTNKTLDAAESINGLSFNGPISGSVVVQAAATTTPYILVLPDAQGAVSTILTNNGSGNLTWEATGANTSLSNLTSPTAINQDLTFSPTGSKQITIDFNSSGPGDDLLISSGKASNPGFDGGDLILQTISSGGNGALLSLEGFKVPDFINLHASNISLEAGSSFINSSLKGGSIELFAGSCLTDGGITNQSGGDISLIAGQPTDIFNYSSGINIFGASNTSSGSIDVYTGGADVISASSGNLNLSTGFSNFGPSGNLAIDTGQSAGLSGSVAISTGNTIAPSSSGDITLQTGTTVGGADRGLVRVAPALAFHAADVSGPEYITVSAPSTVFSYDLFLPSSQGTANTFLKNDGSGNLSWSNASSQINLSGSNASVAIGSPVYIDSSGNAQLIDAADDSKVTFVGISLNVGGGPITVQVEGEVTIPSASFTTGGLVYVNPLVPGAYTQTVPSNAGQWVIPVGTATATNKIAINASGSVAIVKITSEVDSYVYANVTSVSSNTTLTNGNSIVLATGGVGGITVILPAPTSGKIFNIKKVDAAVGSVTISAPSGTIDGSASKSLAAQYDSLTITSDGTNFFII